MSQLEQEMEAFLAPRHREDMVTDKVDAEQAQERDQKTEGMIDSALQGLGSDMPPRNEYDYRAAADEGTNLKPAQEGGVNLPNKHAKRGKMSAAGYDISTGQKVFNDFEDKDGYIFDGVNSLRNSKRNTVLGVPVDDASALAMIAYGEMREGAEYDDFNHSVSDDWEKGKTTAWRAAQQARFRQAYVNNEIDFDTVPDAPDIVIREPYEETDLATNEGWLQDAQTMYEYLEGEPFSGESADLHEWTLEKFSQLNTPLYGGALVTRAAFAPEEFKQALYRAHTAYTNTDWSKEQLFRGVEWTVKDPVTYMGLGAGALAARIGMRMASQNLAKVLALSIVGGVEGGAYSSLDDFYRQSIDVGGGMQEGYDPEQGLQAAGVGAAAGAVLAPAIEPVARHGGKLIRKGWDVAGPDVMRGVIYGTQEINKALTGGMELPFYRSIIAGPKAATADLGALERAQTMKSEGASEREIFDATGWWLGHPDKVPRFEISDYESVFEQRTKRDLVREYLFDKGYDYGDDVPRDVMRAANDYGLTQFEWMKTRGMLRHEELYRAYPAVEDIGLKVEELRRGLRGSFNTQSKNIKLAPENEFFRESPHSVLLHELQHFVQNQEDMGPGGGPGLASEIREKIQEAGEEAQAYIDAERKVSKQFDQPVNEQRIRNAEATVQLMKDIEGLDDFGVYERISGEVEARLTQKRMGMTPEERAQRPFYEDYDIPPKGQIVLRYGGPQESVESDELADNMRKMLADDFPPVVDRTLPSSPKMQVGRFLEEQSLNALGEPLTALDDRTRTIVSDAMLAEAIDELAKHGNANAWYKSTLDNTHRLVGLMHPEVMQDQNMAGAFNFALAVTSNGQKVPDNARYGLRQYEHFKNTGKFEETGWGKQAPSMVTSFKTWNALVDEIGLEKTLQFLNTDFTVKELKAMGFDVGGEAMDAVLPGSVIVGPKIGGGFFTNLQGRWDLPTFDQWWMRMWGRLTGNLTYKKPELAAKQLKAFRRAIWSSPTMLARYGGEKYKGLSIKELNEIPDSELEEFAKKVYNAWSNAGFKDKNKTLHRVSRSIRNRTEELIDVPSGAAQRQFMRETVNETLEKLEAEGVDLEAADLQALVWYPEQRLYDKLGSKQITKEADYEQSFRDIVTARGLDEGTVPRTADVVGEAEGDRPQSVREKGLRATFGEREKRKFTRPRIIREIRRRLREKDETGASGAYRRKDAGDAKRSRFLSPNGRTLTAPVTAVHEPETAVKNALETANLNAQPMLELAPSPESTRLYHRALKKAKSAAKFGESVQLYDEAEYGDMRLFTAEDSSFGFAVKPDGDVVSVFAMPGSDAGMSMLLAAINNGGIKLDAFRTVLPEIYGTVGMRPVARVHWSDEEAPKDWNKAKYKEFQDGEPDVVMFVYDPEYEGRHVEQDIEALDYSEYGDALDLQEQAVGLLKEARGL